MVKFSKSKILCKNKKGRDFRQTSGAEMPRISRTRFSSLELAKVFIEEENLSKLSAFFRFCSGIWLSAASSRAKNEIPELFSVIQLSNIVKNGKERQLQSLFSENFRVTAP